ncbi:MAG: hypothetical protein SFU86_21870 [Pirellulaceae bacterium]|nr:hypothetical protein [Pirellulaceae bacterium]
MLPGFNTGVLGHVASGNGLGLSLGGTFGARVGAMDNWDVLVGVSVFGTSGTARSSWTDTFTSADSAVVVRGTSTPSAPASIDLNRPAANSANSTVTGPGGAIATTTATGATNNVAAVSPDGTGFVMSDVNTGAASAAAFGGIGSSSGGIFIASGNIDGLALTTDVTRNFIYWGADFTVGLQGSPDGQTVVQIYSGPSIRRLTQGVVTSVNVNIPELQPSVLTHPEYRLSIADDLVSNFLGGVAGGNISIPLPDAGIIFTLGAEGGVYAVMSSWTGHDTYSTCCGAVGTPLATPSPNLSVSGPLNTANLGTNVGFSAKGSATVTYLLSETTALSVGGNLEYLSGVPTISRTGVVQTGQAEDWAPGTGTPVATTFGTAGMINYGINFTFSARF